MGVSKTSSEGRNWHLTGAELCEREGAARNWKPYWGLCMLTRSVSVDWKNSLDYPPGGENLVVYCLPER